MQKTKDTRVKRKDSQAITRPARAKRKAIAVAKEAKERQLRRPRVEEAQDIWTGYNPEQVKKALRRSAGVLVGADRDALLTDTHTARQQASRGRPA